MQNVKLFCEMILATKHVQRFNRTSYSGCLAWHANAAGVFKDLKDPVPSMFEEFPLMVEPNEVLHFGTARYAAKYFDVSEDYMDDLLYFCCTGAQAYGCGVRILRDARCLQFLRRIENRIAMWDKWGIVA